MNPFNPSQSRSIASGFRDIHRRFAEIEAFVAQAETESPFSEYTPDLSPTEARVLRDYFARIRATMLGLLRDCDIPLGGRRTSLRWGVQTHLGLVAVAAAELDPRRLEGYGALSEAGRERALQIRSEIDRLVDRVYSFLARHHGPELADRLARLGNTDGADTLRLIDRVVTRWGLVEFRPQLTALARRLEAPEFEIAVFGRVSSGKSSLLNHVAGADVLPVGVTPVTAVPTRLARGDEPACVVSFAESTPRHVPLEQLSEFAAEEHNPGNMKHVIDILVTLPDPRLPKGVVLVDTPGVGSLARAGAAETMAYLPRCDLGVVLVDAASTLNDDDLILLHALADAGTPTQVLLSKADLLAPADRDKSVAYIRRQLQRELGIEVPVYPVSTVGADEALLTEWFDHAVRPILDRHRELVESSLRRKIVSLRQAAAAALATTAGIGSTQATQLADEAAQVELLFETADLAIRTAQDQLNDWHTDLARQDERILREASDTDGAVSTPKRAIAESASRVLADRGREALHAARDLRDALGRTLDELARLASSPGIDPTAVYRTPIQGLPDADLHFLAGVADRPLPWWAATSGLRGRALRNRYGNQLRELLDRYDRSLRLWLKVTQQQLTEAFERQAEVVREQVRRLIDQSETMPDGFDHAALEADFQLLRDGDAPSPTPDATEAVAAGTVSALDPSAGDLTVSDKRSGLNRVTANELRRESR